jgi:NitT/TauT family transport system substrate-binding protein
MLMCAGCGGAAPAPSAPLSALAAKPSAGQARADTGQKAEQSQVKVAFGTVSGGVTFVSVGAAEGLFSPYGLTVMPFYAQGPAAMAALVSGEAQFSMSEAVAAFAGISGGARAKMIGAWDRVNPYAIAARSTINTPADLKGKTIMIGKAGDPADVSARLGLRSVSLTLGTDVQAIEGGNTPQRIAALSSGQVDAAIVDADNFTSVTRGDRNMHILVNMKEKRIPWLTSATVVTDDYARANPNTVFAYMRGLIAATRFYADDVNKQESLKVLAKDLKANPSDPVVESNYDAYRKRLFVDPTPDAASAQIILDALKSIEPARYASVMPDQVIDPSWGQALRASGYLQSMGIN